MLSAPQNFLVFSLSSKASPVISFCLIERIGHLLCSRPEPVALQRRLSAGGGGSGNCDCTARSVLWWTGEAAGVGEGALTLPGEGARVGGRRGGGGTLVADAAGTGILYRDSIHVVGEWSWGLRCSEETHAVWSWESSRCGCWQEQSRALILRQVGSH